jgi:glycosyltransferase involved in cell wall biosynthesis
LIEESSIIFSHPTGNANVRAAAKGLAEAGILYSFNTTLAVFPGDPMFKLGGFSLFKDIRGRSYDPALKKYVNRYPFYETGRMLSSKMGLENLSKYENSFFSVNAVYKKLDQKIALSIEKLEGKEPTGVYAYEDGAVQSFKKAKKTGISCLYDLPIGYWRAKKRLLSQEKSRRPEWAETIPGLCDSDEKLARKDEELALADHIFVASSFTKKTLKEYPAPLTPVHVIPYGFPPVFPKRNWQPLADRKFKILFVGSLSQRKGIADLFEAVNAIQSKIELTVVGKKIVYDCEALNQNLSKHTWIPSLPHHEVLELMRTQDVLLFPSLFEGFGLVITEAMSQGTPVITTERTAGPDLITHRKDGWIVDAGSSEAILEQLEVILKKPGLLESTGRAAMQAARKRPWKVYGRELAECIICNS